MTAPAAVNHSNIARSACACVREVQVPASCLPCRQRVQRRHADAAVWNSARRPAEICGTRPGTQLVASPNQTYFVGPEMRQRSILPLC